MKIAFDCHVIYDTGDRGEEPTINGCLSALAFGEATVEKVSLWLGNPSIIVTKKNESK